MIFPRFCDCLINAFESSAGSGNAPFEDVRFVNLFPSECSRCCEEAGSVTDNTEEGVQEIWAETLARPQGRQ